MREGPDLSDSFFAGAFKLPSQAFHLSKNVVDFPVLVNLTLDTSFMFLYATHWQMVLFSVLVSPLFYKLDMSVFFFL